MISAYEMFVYVLCSKNPMCEIFASFCLVTQLPGKHTAPGMQVLVQGNQVAIVAKFLLGKCLVILFNRIEIRYSLNATNIRRM